MAEDTGALRPNYESNTDVEHKPTDIRSLNDAELSLALALVPLIGTQGSDESGIVSLRDKVIYLPDHKARLALASELVLDDVPWLAGSACAHIRSTERLLHPSIAAKVGSNIYQRTCELRCALMLIG